MIVLAVILAAAGMVYMQSRDAKREAQVVGWARSLVWQSLGLPVTPRFAEALAREDKGDPGRWIVSGDFEVEGGTGQPAGSLSFVAALRQVCGDARSRDCWSLQDLIVEERAVVNDAVLDLKALSDLGFRSPAATAAMPTGGAAGSGLASSVAEQGSGSDPGSGAGAAAEIAPAEIAPIEELDPLEPEGGYRPLERAPLPRARPDAPGL